MKSRAPWIVLLSQMEAGEKRLRKTTREKLAVAMGIGTEQLR